MRASYKPWYCEERYQGSLVSFNGGAHTGIPWILTGLLIGTSRVRRPGSPETIHELRLDVLFEGQLLQLEPWRVVRPEEEKDEQDQGVAR